MKTGLFDVSCRIFPGDSADGPDRLRIDVARGESAACQLAVRREAPPMQWAMDSSTETAHWTLLARGETANEGKLRLRTIDSGTIPVRIRTVGNVPLRHHAEDTPAEELDGPAPALVPDVLFDRDTIRTGVLETSLFWISFSIPHDAAPGDHTIELVLESPSDRTELRRFHIELAVHNIELPDDSEFLITHWLDIGSLCARYETTPDEEHFWQLLEHYLHDLRAHGNTMAWIPWLEPPPPAGGPPLPQLLQIEESNGKFQFGWNRVERYIRICQKLGFSAFEFEHLSSPWGAAYGRNPLRSNGKSPGERIWGAPPTVSSPEYHAFLQALLPEFGTKLRQWKILECSYLHLSDEPQPKDLKNYLYLAAQVREYLPEIKTMDALSDLEFVDAGVPDLPVPIVGCVNRFRRAGIECMCYFCCGPKLGYVNRFLDTPLRSIRICGWLFHRFSVRGFLHWAANNWHAHGNEKMIDPFQVTDADNFPEWPAGDCFIQYPGPDGPLSSIRAELFFFGLQDRLLLKAAKIIPDSPLLKELEDFNRFPVDPQWISQSRKQLFARLESTSPTKTEVDLCQ